MENLKRKELRSAGAATAFIHEEKDQDIDRCQVELQFQGPLAGML
jgi:hypothetical protein